MAVLKTGGDVDAYCSKCKLVLAHVVTAMEGQPEVRVLLVNLSADPYTIAPGDRIAQLVVAEVNRVRVVPVSDESALGETPRGVGGFGSSGR